MAADDDTSPDAARALELAVHLNNLLRAYAEAGPGCDDPLRLLLRLLEDLCRALRELAAEAAHLDRHGARHWLGRSRVGDELLFLIEAVFLLLAERPEEVAAGSRGFVEASLGENLLGTVREVLRRHADYGAFAAEAARGAEAAVGLDFFVAELRSPPDPRDGLRAEVEQLRAELAAAKASLRNGPAWRARAGRRGRRCGGCGRRWRAGTTRTRCGGTRSPAWCGRRCSRSCSTSSGRSRRTWTGRGPSGPGWARRPSAGSDELMCERHQGTDDVRRLPSRPISHNSS